MYYQDRQVSATMNLDRERPLIVNDQGKADSERSRTSTKPYSHPLFPSSYTS